MKSIVEIISDLKKLKGLSDDADVAMLLNIKPKTLTTAKSRNSIPFKKLASFCNKEGISLDWILFGEGEMYLRKVPEMIAEAPPSPPYGGLSEETNRLIDKITAPLIRRNLELLPTDVWMARVLEELIDMLINKGVIQLTDLPSIVWERIKFRKNLRDREIPGKK